MSKKIVIVQIMLLLLVLCCANMGTTYAADDKIFSPVPYTQHFDSISEINLAEVNVIFQSRDGLMWFGTNEGLVRFDGFEATLYSNDPQDPHSLPHNRIFGIEQDKQGRLWLASYGGGLFRFEPQSARFITVDLAVEPHGEAVTPLLYRLTIDNRGVLWIGSRGSPMLYDTVADKPLPLPNVLMQLPTRQVTQAIFDSNDNIWFSTDFDGAFMYDGEQLHQFSKESPANRRIATNKIRYIFEDTAKNIWLSTGDSLNRYNPATDKMQVLKPSNHPDLQDWHDDVYAINDDGQGRLWLGSGGHGVFSYDLAKQSFETVSGFRDLRGHFRDNTVNQIFKDKSGSLWFASQNGVTLLPSNGLRFSYLTNKSEDFYVSDIIETIDHKLLFAGAYQLYELLPNPLKAKLLVDDDRVVYRFDTDKSGDLWLSVMSLGLQHFSSKTQQMQAIPNGTIAPDNKSIRQLREVMVDEFDQIWIISNQSPPLSHGGVLRYQQETATMQWVANIEDSGVLSELLALDQRTMLLSSELRGIYEVDIASGQFTRWRDTKPDAPKEVGPLYKDSSGRLWMGTFNQGLARYDSNTDSFEYFTKSNGLPSNYINSIVEDDDRNLWLGSNVGLTRFNPQTKQVLSIGLQEGLLFPNFFKRVGIKRSDGKILMGSKSGLVQFNPKDFKQPSPLPRAFINDFRLFNKAVPLSTKSKPTALTKTIEFTDQLTLSAEDYVFSFGFSAVEFQRPNQVQFAYRMVGLDEQWVYTDKNNRKASYTTLAAGDYIFEVKAANGDGIWSQQVDQMKITILPYWYLRWEAYLVYLLLILGAIYWYIRRQTAKFIQEAKTLESKVSQRTAELQNSRDELTKQSQTVSELLQQKQRLFASMSHEFRTPLTLILSPIDQLLKRFGDQPMVKELSLIKRNGQRLLRMVDQLLEFAKLEQQQQRALESVSLAQTVALVCASFETLVENKNLTLKVAPCPDVYLMVLPDSLNKILINLLSNAFKYTPAGGHIEVEFERHPSTVIIRVKDDGIGIAQGDQQAIFERFNRATHDHGEAIAGAGIGLSLVKELVEANQGSISVSSQLNQGSAFELVLPLTEYLPVAAKTAQPSKVIAELLELEQDCIGQNTPVSLPAESDENNDSQRQSILIIDDNADMRDLLYDALCQQYHCLQAENGQTGLVVAKEYLPDLILSDIMMPIVDGYELAQRIREDMLTCHIPIILLTAKGSVESRIKGLQLLVDDYMAKPFNIDELKLRIHNILTIRSIVAKRSAQSIDHPAGGWMLKSNSEKAPEQLFVEQVNHLLAENYSDVEFSAKCFSELLGVSERQLNRKIRALFEITIPELVRNFRLKKAAQLLADGQRVSQVYYKVGFASHSYFSSCFKAKFAVTPTEFQNGGESES